MSEEDFDEVEVVAAPPPDRVKTGLPLPELAQRFALLKEAKEHHEHAAKLIGAELNFLGAELFDEFSNTNSKNIKLIGDLFKDSKPRIIAPDLKFRGNIVNPPLFFGYLRKENYGALIKEVVAPQTLDKWIREQKEENRPIPDETMLRVFTVQTAKIRRAAQ